MCGLTDPTPLPTTIVLVNGTEEAAGTPGFPMIVDRGEANIESRTADRGDQ